jgi:hypothetical protein
MAARPCHEDVPVGSEVKDLVQQKSPSNSDPTVAFLVLSCAVLIGASAGLLVAERDASSGKKAAATATPITLPAGLQLKANAEATKNGGRVAGDSAKGSTTAGLSNLNSRPTTASLGAIHCSEESDAATVVVELGAMVLVRTAKTHYPERIYFDLRDSRRPDSKMDKFRAKRTLQNDGNLVTRVRASEWVSGAVRLVLDLKHPCDYTYELTPLPSSHLLVKLQARSLRASFEAR